MDAQPRTRLVKRDVADRPSQGRRGAPQIGIALTRQEYDQLWRDLAAVRRRLLGQCECCPELFPAGFGPGFTLDGMLRESKKLPGVRLRKIVLHDDSIYELRPNFALPDMVESATAVARTSNWDDKSGTCLARKRRQSFASGCGR